MLKKTAPFVRSVAQHHTRGPVWESASTHTHTTTQVRVHRTGLCSSSTALARFHRVPD